MNSIIIYSVTHNAEMPKNGRSTVVDDYNQIAGNINDLIDAQGVSIDRDAVERVVAEYRETFPKLKIIEERVDE